MLTDRGAAALAGVRPAVRLISDKKARVKDAARITCYRHGFTEPHMLLWKRKVAIKEDR